MNKNDFMDKMRLEQTFKRKGRKENMDILEKSISENGNSSSKFRWLKQVQCGRIITRRPVWLDCLDKKELIKNMTCKIGGEVIVRPFIKFSAMFLYVCVITYVLIII